MLLTLSQFLFARPTYLPTTYNDLRPNNLTAITHPNPRLSRFFSFRPNEMHPSHVRWAVFGEATNTRGKGGYAALLGRMRKCARASSFPRVRIDFAEEECQKRRRREEQAEQERGRSVRRRMPEHVGSLIGSWSCVGVRSPPPDGKLQLSLPVRSLLAFAVMAIGEHVCAVVTGRVRLNSTGRVGGGEWSKTFGSWPYTWSALLDLRRPISQRYLRSLDFFEALSFVSLAYAGQS